MSKLEELIAQKEKVQEAINNVLEAGQEFQTRTGRVKMANLSLLRQQLCDIENQITELEGANNGYTDTEVFVFRGCR